MSWDVGPVGLSRLTTPSIAVVKLTIALGQDRGTGPVERQVDGAARRAGVPAAAEG